MLDLSVDSVITNIPQSTMSNIWRLNQISRRICVIIINSRHHSHYIKFKELFAQITFTHIHTPIESTNLKTNLNPFLLSKDPDTRFLWISRTFSTLVRVASFPDLILSIRIHFPSNLEVEEFSMKSWYYS